MVSDIRNQKEPATPLLIDIENAKSSMDVEGPLQYKNFFVRVYTSHVVCCKSLCGANWKNLSLVHAVTGFILRFVCLWKAFTRGCKVANYFNKVKDTC